MSSKDETGPFMEEFERGFEAGRLAHAYLLVGSDGCAGRVAEQMLSVLFCRSPDSRPCGSCPGCRKIIKRMHPDVLWIEPQKKSRTIQRDQILEVQRHVNHTSYEGGWKAVALIGADRMNDVASNTLLKTLEEPPGTRLFLLLSNAPEALLPTIVSRCQRVLVPERAGSEGSCSGGKEIEENVRSVIIQVMTNSAFAGDGVIVGIARARFLLKFLSDVKKELESAEKKRLAKTQADSVEGAGSRELVSARVEAQYIAARNSVLRGLLHWHRDMLLAVCGADADSFFFVEESELIRKISAGLTFRRAIGNLRLIEDMKGQLDRYIVESMVFERAMTGLGSGNVSSA